MLVIADPKTQQTNCNKDSVFQFQYFSFAGWGHTAFCVAFAFHNFPIFSERESIALIHSSPLQSFILSIQTKTLLCSFWLGELGTVLLLQGQGTQLYVELVCAKTLLQRGRYKN